MHPVAGLDKRQKPNCINQIDTLNSCHKDHNILKYFGHCNKAKYNLDLCLRADKAKRKVENKKRIKKTIQNVKYS